MRAYKKMYIQSEVHKSVVWHMLALGFRNKEAVVLVLLRTLATSRHDFLPYTLPSLSPIHSSHVQNVSIPAAGSVVHLVRCILVTEEEVSS